MLRGFYTSAAGMLGQLDRQDAIANNLANVNTAGYKRKTVTFTGFETSFRDALKPASDVMLRNITPLPKLYEDSRQGGLQATDSKTSFAIDGPGSFVISTPNGDQLTRGGSFTLSAKGEIVNHEGFTVMGEKGPIQITGADWNVDKDGNVTSAGAIVDKIKIANGSTDPAKPTTIMQGYLESSNVNTVDEMVGMITALRSYEACQKSIQNLDQTLDKLINQVGKVA